MILSDSLKAWAIGAGVPGDAPDKAFLVTVRRALLRGIMSAEAFVRHTVPGVLELDPSERAIVVVEVQDKLDAARAQEMEKAARRELLADFRQALREAPQSEECFGFVSESLRDWAWQHYELTSTDASRDALVRRLAMIALAEGELLPEDYAALVCGEDKVGPKLAEIVKQALRDHKQADGDAANYATVQSAVERELTRP